MVRDGLKSDRPPDPTPASQVSQELDMLWGIFALREDLFSARRSVPLARHSALLYVLPRGHALAELQYEAFNGD
jgi:hypothetical protein